MNNKVTSVCVVSVHESIVLSIRGLGLDEFQEKINRFAEAQFAINFVLPKNYRSESKNVTIITLTEVKGLPRSISYLISCFMNMRFLLKQDIFVTSSIGIIGVITCLFTKLFRKKTRNL